MTDLCTSRLWALLIFTPTISASKSHSIAKLDIGASGFDLEAGIVGKIRRARLNHIEIPLIGLLEKVELVN